MAEDRDAASGRYSEHAHGGKYAQTGGAVSPCSHDPAQFVTADEGTSYCPRCEAESRVAAHCRPDTSAAA